MTLLHLSVTLLTAMPSPALESSLMVLAKFFHGDVVSPMPDFLRQFSLLLSQPFHSHVCLALQP